MKKSNLFRKFKDSGISELTQISGGAPATTFKGGDVHTTSPQTPGYDDNADRNSNTCDEGKDIFSGPAQTVSYNYDDGSTRASFPQVILVTAPYQQP